MKERRIEVMERRAAIVERIPRPFEIAEKARDRDVDVAVIPWLIGKLGEGPRTEDQQIADEQRRGDPEVRLSIPHAGSGSNGPPGSR